MNTATSVAATTSVAVTIPTQTKPRVGISGGGPSGSRTSVASQINHGASRKGIISTNTRNVITKIARRTPYVGAAAAEAQLVGAVHDRILSETNRKNTTRVDSAGCMTP